MTDKHTWGKDHMGHVDNAIVPIGQTQMQLGSADISALLASRMSHDLISPLGAIGNGLELLQMSQATEGEEFDLIAQSVSTATARLRYFRLAFGAVQEGQIISRTEVTSILNAVADGGKHRYDWESPDSFPRCDAKLVLLLLMCAENALPWGGELRIQHLPDGWRVTGLAHRLKLDDACWQDLQAGRLPRAPTSSRIHFSIAISEIMNKGGSVCLDTDDTALCLTYKHGADT